jgi:hypothetical protein
MGAPYQNWGGIRIQDVSPDSGTQPNVIEFEKSVSNTPPQEEEYNFQFPDNNGRLIQSVKGIRARINTRIVTVNDGDGARLYNFLNLLNSKLNIGGLQNTFWIAPRYDSSKPVNDWYEVYLNSPIAPENGDNFGGFQILNLSFVAVSLANRYSTNIDLTENTSTITDSGNPFDLIVTDSSSDFNLNFTAQE